MLGHTRGVGREPPYKLLSFYIPLAMGWFLLAILKFTVQHISEIKLATEASAPLFTGILSFMKIVTCLWRKDRVFKIIDHLKRLSQSIGKCRVGKSQRNRTLKKYFRYNCNRTRHHANCQQARQNFDRQLFDRVLTNSRLLCFDTDRQMERRVDV
jgi:hypothetical protein